MRTDLLKPENDMLLVDKPVGWTSFDVVAKIRGSIRAEYREKDIKPTKRQLRVGHAGTLDPFATGLLVILLGDGTKKATEFLKLDKVYEATITLGKTSTTGDPEGEITSIAPQNPTIRGRTLKEIKNVLTEFTGEITQTPPQFSAIKIGGQRAYKLARKGEKVDIPTRQVTIHSLELIEYSYPELKIRAHVSSGTYIRSLAEDIGTALGTGAYCSQLRRTQIGQWSINDAQPVDTYEPSSD